MNEAVRSKAPVTTGWVLLACSLLVSPIVYFIGMMLFIGLLGMADSL